MSFDEKTAGMEDAYVRNILKPYLKHALKILNLFQSNLPEGKDVPKHQRKAHGASTTVDYHSELHIMSRAARVRLSGIVCTIGKYFGTH